jgi:hypothetical protein
VQQSSGAAHGAPTGAQLARQPSAPRPSGAQRPAQQSAPTRHENPGAAQELPRGRPRQRMTPAPSARHELGSRSQQSAGAAHSSPIPTQAAAPGRGIGVLGAAQRAFPSGPALQLPEQQSVPAAQRSSIG